MNYTQVLNFNMALQTGCDLAGWEITFVEAGISATSAKMYAQIFSSKEITRDSLHILDQNEISSVSAMAVLRVSAYCQQRRVQDVAQSTATRRRERILAETRPWQNACRDCGSHHHGRAGSGDRPWMCPAWGKQNHFEMVCQSKGAEK